MTFGEIRAVGRASDHQAQIADEQMALRHAMQGVVGRAHDEGTCQATEGLFGRVAMRMRVIPVGARAAHGQERVVVHCAVVAGGGKTVSFDKTTGGYKRTATEQIARDVILSTKRVGGLPAATVPFFPAKGILITRWDNLSLYYQDGKRRRTIIDNPKKNRVEDFQSSNDSYVIEDLDYALLIENIERKDA